MKDMNNNNSNVQELTTATHGSYDPSVRGPVRRIVAKDPILELRSKAQVNKIFNDMMHVFALRERTRRQVTIPGLQLRMKEAGFNYDKSLYQDAIVFLAKLGYGKVETDINGEVFALKSVAYTLQSIGKVALSESQSLEKANFITPRQPSNVRAFSKLPNMIEKPLVVTPEKAAVKVQTVVPKVKFESAVNEAMRASITLYVGNQPVTFPMPDGITTNQLGEILAKLYKKEA